VPPEKSQTLVDGSLNSRVEFHDGGGPLVYVNKHAAKQQATSRLRKRPGVISCSACKRHLTQGLFVSCADA
jgi:hypothetical protein